MEELYKTIEEKIKESGYSKEVDGEAIYEEICDLIEKKENGTYLFISKQNDGTIFEYKVEIMDENFNLSYIHITEKTGMFHINFDL